MDDIFRKISPQSIPKWVVRQLMDLIRDGKLHPGDKLPSERILAERLGVGRSSLREAINSLETLGLVEKKNREGIFICSIASPIISDPIMQIIEEDEGKFFDLYDIRKDIEMASACVAAHKRTTNDLAAMKDILNKMKGNAEKVMIERADDLDFHMSVAAATHNLLRTHILKSIFDLFGDFITHVANKLNKDRKNVTLNIEQHEAIFKAISEGDSEMAQDLMGAHLTWVENIWRELRPKGMGARSQV